MLVVELNGAFGIAQLHRATLAQFRRRKVALPGFGPGSRTNVPRAVRIQLLADINSIASCRSRCSLSDSKKVPSERQFSSPISSVLACLSQ